MDAELIFGAESATSASRWTRFGAHAVDMSHYPAVDGFTRQVRFVVDVQSTVHSATWHVEVRLFDVTHNVEVSGSLLSNAGLADRSAVTDLTSAALVVGSASGNIRSDVAAIYSAQVRVCGTISNPTTEEAVLGNGRLRIVYVLDT